MDKLELDVRVAALEQRLAKLTAMCILAVTAAIAMLLLFMLRQGEVGMPATAPPMPTLVTETALTPPTPPVDFTEGTVGHLTVDLGELSELKRQSLISDSEYKAKKAQLLAREMRSTAMKAELEALNRIHQEGILSRDEFTSLKGKVLDLGK